MTELVRVKIPITVERLAQVIDFACDGLDDQAVVSVRYYNGTLIFDTPSIREKDDAQ